MNEVTRIVLSVSLGFILTFLCMKFLPLGGKLLGHDRGRLYAPGSEVNIGKPTGVGIYFVIIFVLVSLIFGFTGAGLIYAMIFVLFSMLFAVVFSFAVFTAPVSAADSAKAGVTEGPKTVYLKALETSGLNENNRGGSTHADPATFEKNFCLSAAQKEYTITEIERVVARILKPGMSDLEKYYRLAVWENKRAKYDWEFWNGDYDFELYRHQWDSFGVLTEKSVCVGMAITYAALCHAADLPCKFVRTDTSLVDHTMNYIPDINGHAYCVDVTENAL